LGAGNLDYSEAYELKATLTAICRFVPNTSTVLTVGQIRLIALVVGVIIVGAIGCSDSPTETGPAITTLTITNAPSDSLEVGGTVALTYEALDASGNPVEGAQITWSSSDTEIAEVASSGVLTANGIGATATITAKGGGATATAAVKVRPIIITIPDHDLLFGINDAGEMAGADLNWVSYDQWVYAPFRASAERVVTMLPTAPADGQAWAIDNLGRVVGGVTVSNIASHAARWTGTQIEDLGNCAPDSAAFASAAATNNNGMVVGYCAVSGNPASSIRGFVWTSAAGFQVTATLGGNETWVWGVNDAGDIVGQSNTVANGSDHAFIRLAGQTALTDIGTLGGGQAVANDINGAKQVVGSSTTSIGASHAFIWTQSEGMTDLGVLSGRLHSYAQAINESGQVVGSSDGNSLPRRPFIWSKKYGMIDLGSPSGAPTVAYGVNSSGVVVGFAYGGGMDGIATIWITKRVQ
jgi:probable HAF family extracellular repeat protein